MAWSPDGRYLISIDNAGVARLWDGPRMGGTVLRRAPIQPATATFSAYSKRRGPDEYSAMDLHPDGAFLALGTGSSVEFVATDDGRLLEVQRGLHQSQIRTVIFSPGGETLASASNSGRLCLSPTPSFGKGPYRQPVPPKCADAQHGSIPAIAYADGGRSIVSGFSRGVIQIRDASTLTLKRELRLRAGLFSLAANRDGTLLALSYLPESLESDSPRIDLFDVRTGKFVPMEDTTHESRFTVRTLLFDPQNPRLYAGDAGLQGIGAWDLNTRRQVRSFPGAGRQGSGSRGLALSPDGQILVSTFGDGALGIWDANTGDPLLQFLRQPMAQVCFSPDGARLFVNTYDAIETFDTRVSAAARRPIRFPVASEEKPGPVGGAQ